MSMKNNKKILWYLIPIYLFLNTSLFSEELDISALNIKLLQDEEKILAEGDVVVKDQDGIIIETETATYDKKENILKAEEGVKITDTKTAVDINKLAPNQMVR